MLKKIQVKRKILAILLEEGELTTSKISRKTKIHFYRVRELLNELLEEKKIEKDSKGRYTFWRYKYD